MLGMAYIRALEVATFYFMFQLQPVGSVAHIQVCGTTSCMICGAEDLIAVCKQKIAGKAHQLSADGKFSWEEVECLGSCANAPMAQIGKDYYEDLTAARMGEIIDELAAGKVPVPGPQNGRFAAEPKAGLTSLKRRTGEAHNGSVALALAIGDTVKRIDGTEVPLRAPWRKTGAAQAAPAARAPAKAAAPKKARAAASQGGGGRSHAHQGGGAEGGADPQCAGDFPVRPDRGLDRSRHRAGWTRALAPSGAGPSGMDGSNRRRNWPGNARQTGADALQARSG